MSRVCSRAERKRGWRGQAGLDAFHWQALKPLPANPSPLPPHFLTPDLQYFEILNPTTGKTRALPADARVMGLVQLARARKSEAAADGASPLRERAGRRLLDLCAQVHPLGKPHTLHPTLYTLHFTPHPHTLPPTPCTLQPCSPHPTYPPNILHPRAAPPP